MKGLIGFQLVVILFLMILNPVKALILDWILNQIYGTTSGMPGYGGAGSGHQIFYNPTDGGFSLSISSVFDY